MKKELTRIELQGLTRDEFIAFLRENDYQVEIFQKEDNYILIDNISNDELTDFCALYGTVGQDLFDNTALISHWGCYSVNNDEVPINRLSVEDISKEISLEYEVKMFQPPRYMNTLEIYNINEKKFRELIIRYSIQYYNYNYKRSMGRFSFFN